jgi:hypothetical protein
MKRQIRFRAWMILVLAVPVLAACDHKELNGTYTATTFTYASTGSPAQDVLAAGGSINLSIARDLTTSGSMSIPASLNGGTAFSISLLGTAAQLGDSVKLNLVQDSFLRDMFFMFDGSSLSGSGTFDGTTVVVTLSK